MSRVIKITEELYEKLTALKEEGETYSEVVSRMISPRPTLRKELLEELDRHERAIYTIKMLSEGFELDEKPKRGLL